METFAKLLGQSKAQRRGARGIDRWIMGKDGVEAWGSLKEKGSSN